MEQHTSDLLCLYRKSAKHDEILEKLSHSIDSLQITIQEFRHEVQQSFDCVRGKLINNIENSIDNVLDEFQSMKAAKTSIRDDIQSIRDDIQSMKSQITSLEHP
jgi:predicted  nucleic acid-binding Zn-ribbon protein